MFKRGRINRIHDVTAAYLERDIDSRMVEIIDEQLRGCASVVDVGCGRGQYGSALARVTGAAYAIDHDATLCDAARATGAYRRIVCAPVDTVAEHFPGTEAVFCSELLEHIPPPELRAVARAIESAATRRVVITVPNPRSPHYRQDPTHVGKYTVHSLRRFLDESARFRYRLLPLGFSDQVRAEMPWTRALHPVASRIASFSPTVLYVGSPRNG